MGKYKRAHPAQSGTESLKLPTLVTNSSPVKMPWYLQESGGKKSKGSYEDDDKNPFTAKRPKIKTLPSLSRSNQEGNNTGTTGDSTQPQRKTKIRAHPSLKSAQTRGATSIVGGDDDMFAMTVEMPSTAVMYGVSLAELDQGKNSSRTLEWGGEVGGSSVSAVLKRGKRSSKSTNAITIPLIKPKKRSVMRDFERNRPGFTLGATKRIVASYTSLQNSKSIHATRLLAENGLLDDPREARFKFKPLVIDRSAYGLPENGH